MYYRDGTLKRNVIDQVDRYTAAIRMRDETFVFPAPALLDPPRTLPAGAASPRVHQDDGDGDEWFLRFDGVDDRITQGPIAMPPGPAPWASGIRATGLFKGDIRQFRVLQRSLTPDEIAARHERLSPRGAEDR